MEKRGTVWRCSERTPFRETLSPPPSSFSHAFSATDGNAPHSVRLEASACIQVATSVDQVLRASRRTYPGLVWQKESNSRPALQASPCPAASKSHTYLNYRDAAPPLAGTRVNVRRMRACGREEEEFGRRTPLSLSLFQYNFFSFCFPSVWFMRVSSCTYV